MSERQTPSSQPHHNRVVRVFISSTFRDMKEERDYLVKFIFPQLRKLCEQREVVWGEVDLRWGVTDEQKAEGQVLPICLEEIKRCRPYFIGILGERYGWVPDEIPEELIEREDWLKEHLKHSVTELEILHGVLNNPDMAKHAFFYFRDPAYIESLPQEEKSNFTTEDAESAEKLQRVKDRIRSSGFPVHDNYPDPKACGELVLQDLTKVINDLYPEGTQPDPLARDAADHEAFARSRARVYIGREEYFTRLDEHIDSDNQPLVILGESGAGKSALIANWVMQYRERHPEDFLLMHFIGASPYSADWAAMLRRIMGEFKRRFNIQQEIPDKPDELRMAFANFMHTASASCCSIPSSPVGEGQGDGVHRPSRIILILDALNQLEDRDAAPDLVWLLPVIPENVRIILSTLTGRPLEELKRRDWETLNVEPFNQDERRVFIERYLVQYNKTLSPARAEYIASSKQTANPLYLKVLLEELRLFGKHEMLEQKINYYLQAENIPDLFGKVLARWEEDYEGYSDLVGDVMSLIWASRRGLTEAELLDILGSDGEPLPKAVWSPLYLAAESHLISRSGLINFSHDYLRESVCETYVPSEENQKKAHLRLADYFDKKELHTRKVDELPWQFASAKAWDELKDLLTQPDFFMSAFKANVYDVAAYWAKLDYNSYNKVDAYRFVLDKPEQADSTFVWNISKLMSHTGQETEALSLREYLVKLFRQEGNLVDLQACLCDQAIIHMRRGELDKAMILLKEQERICRELGDKVGLSISFGNQAIIHSVRGQLDEAMRLHQEGESICRELGNKDGLQRSLGNQANIHYARGELDEAMRLHQEEESICREMGNKGELIKSLNNQGTILSDRGEDDEAMRLFKEGECIFRETGDKVGLQASLHNQAQIFKSRGEFDEAMRLLKEEERMCREIGDKFGLQTSLHNQALIFKSCGDFDEAMRLLKEEERICRELGNKDGLQRSLGNQAIIHYEHGELDEAMRLLKEQEYICREMGDSKGLAISLSAQAICLKARGKMKEALFCAEEAYRISDADGQAVAQKIKQRIERICQRRTSAVEVSIPTPHAAADPHRAAQLNIQYHEELKRWKALPLWKRLRTKKPEPPGGI